MPDIFDQVAAQTSPPASMPASSVPGIPAAQQSQGDIFDQVAANSGPRPTPYHYQQASQTQNANAPNAPTAAMDWKKVIPMARQSGVADDQLLQQVGQWEPQLAQPIAQARANGASSTDLLNQLGSTGTINSPQPGFLSQAGHFVRDTLEKTAQNLNVQKMLDQIGQADDLAGQGRYSEAWNAIRGLLPGASDSQQVLGNQQGTTLGEQRDFAKDTYDKLQAKDYSGASANITTAALGNAEHAGKLGEQVTNAVEKAPELAQQGADRVADASASARNTVADALNASAKKNTATYLNPTTKINKALTQDQVADGLIDRGVKVNSLQDLRQQAQAHIEDLGSQIDEAFENHADAGTTVSPQPILDQLEQEKQNYIVDGVPINQAYVDRVTALQKQLEDVANANGGQVPLTSLRAIRQIHDKTIAQSKGGFALAPDDASAIDALKTYTDAIRSSVAETDPELSDLNKEFSFWKNVDKVAGDTLTRKTGQRSPLTQKFTALIGTGLGGAIGHATGIPGAEAALGAAGGYLGNEAGKFGNSAFYKSRMALAKRRLADLLSTEDESPAGPITGSTTPLAQDVENVPQSAHAGATESVPAGSGRAAGKGNAVPDALPAEGGDSRSGGLSQADGYGSTTSVRAGAGRRLAATYRLRELDQIQPSHSGFTFQPNPKYGLGEFQNERDYANAVNQAKIVNASLPSQFDPSLHVTDITDATNGPVVTDEAGNVLSGNGRTNILQRVYGARSQQMAGAYRQMLLDKAGQFGLDPEAIRSMKRPVLVREIPDSEFAGYSKQNAISDFNKPLTAALTPGERAISDSRRVSPETLEDMAGRLDAEGPGATIADVLKGKQGNEVLQKLIHDGVVSPQERAAFQNEDGLTKAGRERISQLMIGRFFRDPEQLDTIPPSVRNKVERMAVPLAQVEAKGDWNLTPDVQQAIDIVDRANKLGIRSISDFIQQDGLFGKDKYSDEAVRLAKALQTAKSTELTAAARQYAGDASYAEKGDSLLGDTPHPKDSFEATFGNLKSGAQSDAERLMQRKGPPAQSF